MITLEQSIKLGSKKEDALKYLEHLDFTMNKFEINTLERKSHFLSQLYEESGCLSKNKENLNYSAKRLMEVWPKRFPTIESTNGYVMNTEALAGKVYEGRTALGNTQPGDGKKFLGRGLIQLTGRDLYTRCGNYLGIDLVNHPELLEEPKYSVLSAGWYWNLNKLNNLADVGGEKQVELITKVVNGGLGNLNQRKEFYNKAKQIFGV